ncbi:MAG TPA: hypothetical protein VLE94_03625 [Burkholderiaceae bacterium]|nr:hypothetical protein [Burkholderiaceae bacterium]
MLGKALSSGARGLSQAIVIYGCALAMHIGGAGQSAQPCRRRPARGDAAPSDSMFGIAHDLAVLAAAAAVAVAIASRTLPCMTE